MMTQRSDHPIQDAGAEFRFADVLAGVWGSDDLTADLERTTGSLAVRLLPVTDGPAAMWSAVAPEADADDLDEQLRSAFGSADEAAVYQRTASNILTGAGALHEAAFVMVVRLYANDKWQQRFRTWLHGEHLPLQPSVGGVRWAHLYETRDWSRDGHFLNIWGADDPDLFDSAEWAEVRDTPRYLEEAAGVFDECRAQRQIFRVG
jgi:hypothetical protein